MDHVPAAGHRVGRGYDQGGHRRLQEIQAGRCCEQLQSAGDWIC
jgi:hypothetical protein